MLFADELKYEKNKEIIKWNSLDNFKVDRYYAPQSRNELQQILKSLSENKIKFRIIGSNHSYNDALKNTEALITLSKMPRLYEYRESDQTVLADSAFMIMDLMMRLDKIGRVIDGPPHHGWQSLGGAVATGSHNARTSYGALYESVLEMTIMTPQGDILEIKGEEELRLYRVNVGALGIMLDMRMRTAPSRRFTIVESDHQCDKLEADYPKIAKAGERVSIAYFPYFNHCHLTVWKSFFGSGKDRNRLMKQGYQPAETIPDKGAGFMGTVMYHLVLFLEKNFPSLYLKVQKGILDKMIGKDKKFISILHPLITMDHAPNPLLPKRGTRKALSHIIHTEMVEFEVAIPVENFFKAMYRTRQFLEKLRDEKGIYYSLWIGGRFVGASDKAVLAANYKKDIVFTTFHFRPKDSEIYKQLAKIMMDDFGGRLHLGKVIFDYAKSDFWKSFPAEDIKAFTEKMKENDPDSLMVNEYVDRLFLREN